MVPGALVAAEAASSLTDHGHSLRSLSLPPAALPSFPTNTPTGTVATLNPLRYRGYVYDPETGFYYLQSRYYNPQTGRFLSADVAKPLSILSGNVPAKMDVYGRLSKTDINENEDKIQVFCLIEEVFEWE